jgi:hypothetical protein
VRLLNVCFLSFIAEGIGTSLNETFNAISSNTKTRSDDESYDHDEEEDGLSFKSGKRRRLALVVKRKLTNGCCGGEE